LQTALRDRLDQRVLIKLIDPRGLVRPTATRECGEACVRGRGASLNRLRDFVLAPVPASAAIVTYNTTLSGPAEVPPDVSPAIGFAIVTIDDSADTMRVQEIFSGLLGTTTASHIDCCFNVVGNVPGVATQSPTFVGFPLGRLALTITPST
jgi:hypothetical protein